MLEMGVDVEGFFLLSAVMMLLGVVLPFLTLPTVPAIRFFHPIFDTAEELFSSDGGEDLARRRLKVLISPLVAPVGIGILDLGIERSAEVEGPN